MSSSFLTRFFLGALACLLSASLLTACGADVASSAATTATLQAQQLQQAKAQEAQFKKKLDEAMQAGNAARAATDQ